MKKLLVLLTLGGLLLAGGLYAAMEKDQPMAKQPMDTMAGTARAIFAGGCFWCMEAPFEKLDGVLSATSGYIGGSLPDPSYQAVSEGDTGHAEAVEIIFDPKRVSYEQLLEIFWQQIDPTDGGGQFVDRGSQYRSAIFYLDEEQRQKAEASKQQLAASGRFKRSLATGFKQELVTEIVPATTFYPAEEYHQDYYKKNPLRYKYYRNGSGRDQFLDAIWGKDRPH